MKIFLLASVAAGLFLLSISDVLAREPYLCKNMYGDDIVIVDGYTCPQGYRRYD